MFFDCNFLPCQSLIIHGCKRSWERASMAWKRSTVRTRPGPPKLLKHLRASARKIPRPWSPTGVQTPFDAWAAMGTVWISMLPTTRSPASMSWQDWAPWAPSFTLVVCWRRQQLISLLRMLPNAPAPAGAVSSGLDITCLAGSRHSCRLFRGQPADRVHTGHSTDRKFGAPVAAVRQTSECAVTRALPPPF